MSEEPPASSSPEVPVLVIDFSGYDVEDLGYWAGADLAAVPTNITLEKFSGSRVDVLGEWAANTDGVRRFGTLDIQASIACVKNVHVPYPCLFILTRRRWERIGLIFVPPNSGEYDQCRTEFGYVFVIQHMSNWILLRALQQAMLTIFEDRVDLERLEAKVEVDDIFSQITFDMIPGFQREGVLRRYRRLEGKTVDVAVYSFLYADLQDGRLPLLLPLP